MAHIVFNAASVKEYQDLTAQSQLDVNVEEEAVEDKIWTIENFETLLQG